MNLGILLREQGQPAEALATCRKAIEREKLVQEHPTVPDYQAGLAWSYANQGVAQLVSGRPADAVISCQRAVELREKLARDYPGSTDYQVGLGWSYANLGVAQADSGRPSEAEISHGKAINIRAKLLQDNPALDDYKHEIALSCRDLGNAERAMGKISQAAGLYRAAVEIRAKLAATYPKVATVQSNLATDLVLYADSLAFLGQWIESADMYAKAVGTGDRRWQTMAACARTMGRRQRDRLSCGIRHSWPRYGTSTAPDALLSITLALVAGDKALSDMPQVLAIAERPRRPTPRTPVPRSCWAGQIRGNNKEAIATLGKALADLDQTAPAIANHRDQILVFRVTGEAILAMAYRDETGENLPQKQLDALRELIQRGESPPSDVLAACRRGPLPSPSRMRNGSWPS